MAQQMLTRYYEVRCQVAPYPQPTDLIVEATDWDEVLHKYPDAELLAICGERHYPRTARPDSAASPAPRDNGRVVITSHPSASHRRRSLFGPPRCGICGRLRLSRTEYAWRQANGLAVWRCQHRRSSRSSSRDVIDALMVTAALAVVTLWLQFSTVHI